MVRVKYRYIVVKIDALDAKPEASLSLNDSMLYACISKYVQKFYGDHGAASIRFGLKCKYVNDKTRIAIFRIKHLIHRFVSSILPLIPTVGASTVKFTTLYSGATIMQCNRFIIEYQKKYLDQCVKEIKSMNQRNIVAKNLMEISTVTM